jgi:glutathione synthase/RimK-type ligase-like ATP-grasp enzyme
VVTKSVLALRISRDGEMYVPYTHTVRRRDLANYQAVRFAPMIVQEQIPKRLELRITVVGTRVFAAEIHSQASRLTRDDWRRECNGDLCFSYYAPHALPAAIEALCIRLVQTLRLCFGAIDMIVTPDGEYIFLEINPNGQWNWIQDLTGLPIAEAIAELLVRGAVFPVEEEPDAKTI